MSADQAKTPTDSMRLDKWLWCARFFKTRSMATEAIRGGKIRVDGQRPKPARTITVGNNLQIHKGAYEYRITIDALSSKRLGGTAATALYTESEDSIAERDQLSQQLKADSAALPRPKRRPDKRERREIMEFNRKKREP